MTNEQHPDQFDWATELSDAQGRVTLSAQEANEIGARLRSMCEKLKAYEDLDGAASDVQLLRMGYAAARLEIESLQARIKTMAEEHADELMVAHLDGRMLAAQPAPQQEAHHLAQALTDPENQPNQYGVEFGMSGQQMHFKIGNQLFRLAYEPDDQQEFEFMKRMLISAFSTFTPDVKVAPQQEAQEPVAWYVTGGGRLLDEDEAKAEARHIGGTARAMPLYAAPQADSQPAEVRDYPPLPDFDSDDGSIWNAIFKWGEATPGSDAHQKANAVESAIIDQLRAYVDADRAAQEGKSHGN